MPYNARRRGLRIVAPLTPNREQELIGGLKNALARGETLVKAKQSFINAGYKQAEVEAASRKVPTSTSQISKPMSTQSTPTQPTSQQPTPQLTTTTPTQSKNISKKLIIILIVSSALILIGAAILGLFWDSWFP